MFNCLEMHPFTEGLAREAGGEKPMEKKLVTMVLVGGGALLLVGIGGYFATSPETGPERKVGPAAPAGLGGPIQPGGGTGNLMPQGGTTGGGTPSAGFQTGYLPQQPFSSGTASGPAAISPVPAGRNDQAEKKPVPEEKRKQKEMAKENHAKVKQRTAALVNSGKAWRNQTQQRAGRTPDPSLRQQFPDVAILPAQKVIYPEEQ